MPCAPSDADRCLAAAPAGAAAFAGVQGGAAPAERARAARAAAARAPALAGFALAGLGTGESRAERAAALAAALAELPRDRARLAQAVLHSLAVRSRAGESRASLSRLAEQAVTLLVGQASG